MELEFEIRYVTNNVFEYIGNLRLTNPFCVHLYQFAIEFLEFEELRNIFTSSTSY